MVASPLIHGTVSGYQRGCRCEKCRRARSDYSKEYRRAAGKVKRKHEDVPDATLEELMASLEEPLPRCYIAGLGWVEVER